MTRIIYIWRVFAKVVSFAVFGLGSLLIGAGIFPLIILVFRKPGRSTLIMRRVISLCFRAFIVFMRVLGLITIRWTGELKEIQNSGGKILIANHPSLLDIVFIISRIDRADCIVKSSLFRFPLVRLVVGKLYISNELTGQDMVDACSRSLYMGNTLVIFPEGTRTTGKRMNPMKRGAARISLQSGRPSLPLRIITSDVTGLGKGDRFFSYRKNGPIEFTLEVGKPVFPDKYRRNGDAADCRILNDVYRGILEDTSMNRDTGVN